MKNKTINYTIGAVALAIILGCGGSVGGTSNSTIFNQIYYQSDQNGDFDIYRINLDGTGNSRLTTSTDNEFNAFLNGNGTLVIFRRDVGSAAEVMTMSSDGSNVVNLTNNAAADPIQDFNNATNRIIFRSDRNGNPDLYTTNISGGGLVQLTNNASSKANPRYNPAGTKVLYFQFDGDWDLWTVNVNGLGAVNLTNDAAFDAYAEWSPDGSKIAWECGGEICVMNADGTGRTVLTTAGGTYPAWSPDGTKIVYHRNGGATGFDIVTMNANGTGEFVVSGTTETEVNPTFSKDGSKIIFTTILGGDRDIFTVNPDGTGRTKIVDTPGEASEPRAF